jgi:glycosyltransferase involved in cell wall biosynthesis
MTRTLNVSLITLGDPAKLTGGYLYHRRMAEAAPAHEAKIEFVSVPEKMFPIAVSDGREAMRRALAKRPDVVVVDSIAAAFVAPWLRPRDRVAGILHQPPGGIDHGPTRTRVQSVLDRLAYRKMPRLLVASGHLADELAAQGVPRWKIVVVPPGRDVAAPPPSDPPDLRRGRRCAVLCVANWIPRKGILELLEAVARIPTDAATLHLVGDARADPIYAGRVRSRLSRSDLRDRVVVHGPVSSEEVAALYAGADVFALPSTKEPYGTVWGEAMAAGLPVVGWRAGNLPYLADDRVEGFLLTPGDVRGLAGALRLLADDEGLGRRMGEAGARRAAARPTWKETSALFFATLREVARID